MIDPLTKLSFYSAFFLLLLFSACNSSGTQNIKAYYFPFDDLKDGRVYEYRPVNDPNQPVEYWYYRTLESDSATYFTGNYYDHDFVVRQFSNEEIISNGTLLHSYFLYQSDSLGIQTQVPAIIESGNVFPFEVKDSTGVFLMKLKWVFQEEPEISTTLIRNRRYMGKTKYTFKNKEYDAVSFKLTELVDDFNNGHLGPPQYNGQEIYAKGLGLVYYKKEINERFILEYELVDTFSMKKLESMYQGTIGMR